MDTVQEMPRAGGLLNGRLSTLVCEICESNYSPFYKTKIGIICQSCKRVMDNELVLQKLRALDK